MKILIIAALSALAASPCWAEESWELHLASYSAADSAKRLIIVAVPTASQAQCFELAAALNRILALEVFDERIKVRHLPASCGLIWSAKS